MNEQAEKAKHKGNDDEEEDEDVKYVRKWYMPWKKVKVAGASKRVSILDIRQRAAGGAIVVRAERADGRSPPNGSRRTPRKACLPATLRSDARSLGTMSWRGEF